MTTEKPPTAMGELSIPRGVIRDWFYRKCKGDEWNEPHVERFVQSAEFLIARCELATRQMNILDVGGGSPFTEFMREFTHGHSVVDSTNDTYDLREYAAWPSNTKGQWYDLVVCMEVLEHVKDMDPPYGTAPRHCFDGSGATHVLSSCRTALSPQGKLFLTTPNACGWKALHRAFRAASPRVYDPHVREYAPHELSAMLLDAGLEVEHFDTRSVWGDHMRPQHKAVLANIIERPELHEDDMFVLARRAD